MAKERLNEGFETGIIESWDVERVRRVKSGDVYFTLILNGVSINGCRIREYKEGKKTLSFISLPSYKGSDGKYYSHVYFRFADEDQDIIIDKVYEELENTEQQPKGRRR